MKRITGMLGITLLMTLSAAMTGCSKDATTAEAKALSERANQAAAAPYQTLVVPTGTNFVAVLQTELKHGCQPNRRSLRRHHSRTDRYRRTNTRSGGARINGILRDVQASGRIKDRARMTLVYQDIVDSSDKVHAIAAQPLQIQAASKVRNDVVKIAAGGAIGAILGAISGKKNGVLVGAAAGAGAGTILVLATKGEDVELTRGLKLYVEMTGPASFRVATR
jgi:outer membrane lipoprotein SlyB